MSWAATKYAWKCSHVEQDVELIKGTTKLLLLAVAYLIPTQHHDTPPTSLRELEGLTGIQARQLRTCRDVLKRLRELEVEGAGQLVVYRMVGMTGPLFMVPNAAKIADYPAKIADPKSAKIAGLRGENAGGVLSLSSSTNNTCSTTTTPEEVEVGVEEFLDWFLVEYPKHRNGVLYQVNLSAAEKLVRSLLRGRSVSRLKAMAVRMWQEPTDPFILDSDYSLYVLQHCATRLETAVVAQVLRVSVQPLPAEDEAWVCSNCERVCPAKLRVCFCGEGRPVLVERLG